MGTSPKKARPMRSVRSGIKTAKLIKGNILFLEKLKAFLKLK